MNTDINFIDSNDWKHIRDENLANLFYGCVTFSNDNMLEDCINKWCARYGEINSLFYCKENTANFPPLQNPTEPTPAYRVNPVYNLLQQKNVPWGKMSPTFFKRLETEGFVMLSELAYDIMIYSVKESNKDLMDYLIPHLDLENTRRFKHVARFMMNKSDDRELLQYLMHQPVLKAHKEELFALTVLWGCAFNNLTIMDFLHSLGSHVLDKISKKAYSLINDDEYIVTIQTKTGLLGNKQEVIASLGYHKLGYTVQNKEGIKQKTKI